MSASTARENEILQAVDRFLKEHNEWASSTDRETPDEDYWDAYDEMIRVVDEGDTPRSLRQLVAGVGTLDRERIKFDHSQEDADDQMPHAEFWAAREDLAHVRTTQARDDIALLKPLETIQELREQKVTDSQIAKIYGLFMANGEPASHLIQREIDKPGSVIDAKWVDPRVREIRAEREAKERESDEDAREGLSARRRRAEQEEKPCPETPHELWEQKVSVAQSAKMLKMTETKVAELFKRFAKEREDMLAGKGAPKNRAPAEPESSDEGADDADSEAVSDEKIQEIAELAREGMKPKEIGEQVGLDGRRVAGIIRTLNKKKGKKANQEAA